MTSAYYHPEHLDLVPVGAVEDDEPYQFDIVAVWVHVPSRRMFWARDNGCSCPAPFENYTLLEHLTEVSVRSFHDLHNAVTEHARACGGMTPKHVELVAEVSRLLREPEHVDAFLAYRALSR